MQDPLQTQECSSGSAECSSSSAITTPAEGAGTEPGIITPVSGTIPSNAISTPTITDPSLSSISTSSSSTNE
jgi:hypothetical protein